MSARFSVGTQRTIVAELLAADEAFVYFDDATQLVKIVARAARLAGCSGGSLDRLRLREECNRDRALERWRREFILTAVLEIHFRVDERARAFFVVFGKEFPLEAIHQVEARFQVAGAKDQLAPGRRIISQIVIGCFEAAVLDRAEFQSRPHDMIFHLTSSLIFSVTSLPPLNIKTVAIGLYDCLPLLFGLRRDDCRRRLQ